MSVRFNPKGMWGPNGRAFSQGVVQGNGRVLHITGQVAWDADSQIVGIGDVGAQFEKCIENTQRVLAQIGGKLDDIVSLTVYFTNRENLPVIQNVRAKHFRAATAPASTLIQVPGLVLPEFLIEIVPVAVIPEERFRNPDENDVAAQS
jgi:enamine deaminase RidA (YjgF/YER057c/UK114 family)